MQSTPQLLRFHYAQRELGSGFISRTTGDCFVAQCNGRLPLADRSDTLAYPTDPTSLR